LNVPPVLTFKKCTFRPHGAFIPFVYRNKHRISRYATLNYSSQPRSKVFTARYELGLQLRLIYVSFSKG